MARKKSNSPSETLGLKLTQAERKLILDGRLSLPKQVEETIRAASPTGSVWFTRDARNALAGQVATAVEHAEEKTLQTRFDRIAGKIEDLLAPSTDEPEPASSEAPAIVPIPSKARNGKELFPLTLTESEREALLHATRLRRGLKNRFGQVAKGTLVVELTSKELEETASEVDAAAPFAPTPTRRRWSGSWTSWKLCSTPLRTTLTRDTVGTRIIWSGTRASSTPRRSPLRR